MLLKAALRWAHWGNLSAPQILSCNKRGENRKGERERDEEKGRTGKGNAREMEVGLGKQKRSGEGKYRGGFASTNYGA